MKNKRVDIRVDENEFELIKELERLTNHTRTYIIISALYLLRNNDKLISAVRDYDLLDDKYKI